MFKKLKNIGNLKILKNISIGKKLAVGFSVSLMLLIAIGGISYQSTNNQLETAYWVDHTYEVLANLETLLANLTDAETGQRGYLLTGADEYLEPHTSALSNIAKVLGNIRSLTSDNDKQQKRLEKAEPLVAAKLAELQQTIDLRRDKSLKDAMVVVLSGEGKLVMDKLRVIIDEMLLEEKALLKIRSAESEANASFATGTILGGTLLAVLLVLMFSILITRSVTGPLLGLRETAKKVAAGEKDVEFPDTGKDEIGQLTDEFKTMLANLKETNEKIENDSWVKNESNKLSEKWQASKNLGDLMREVATDVAKLLEAGYGAIYRVDENKNNSLHLAGSYAQSNVAKKFKLGEGLVGQCAQDKDNIDITDIPEGYIKITSSLGNKQPNAVHLFPVIFEDRVLAVVELASFHAFDERSKNVLATAKVSLAIVMNNLVNKAETERLLGASKESEEKLQTQSEELQSANQELEEKTQELEEQTQKLEEQQAELEEQRQQFENQKLGE